jgi:putative tricarboxylic transport membrane protein
MNLGFAMKDGEATFLQKSGEETMRDYRRHTMPALACAALFLAAPLAQAQTKDWRPQRTIEIVVPSAPGGGLDVTGRTVQHILQEGKLIDQASTVVNKPGGSTTVGIAYINQHRGDAHYILVQSPPLLTNTITGTTPVGLKDVTPVALLVTEEIIFSVAADSPIKNAADLARMLKNDSASVTIAVSSSPGGHSHAAAALVAKAAGGDPKKLKMVFFNSGAESATALLGGHVMLAATPASSILGHRQAGKLRVIGIPTEKRLAGALADAPTFKEQGYDVVFSAWRAMVGPKNMTPAQLAWWDATLAKVTATPEWKAAAERNEWTLDFRDSTQVAAFFDEQSAKLAEVLGELGLAR